LELAFNFAWMGLAVALFLSCGRAPSLAARHRPIAGAIALACIMALLFPVISISDDLVNKLDLAESGSSKKWTASSDMAGPMLSTRMGAPPSEPDAQREAQQDSSGRSHSPELSSSNLDRRPPPALCLAA
jgi:hypothetical protein